MSQNISASLISWFRSSPLLSLLPPSISDVIPKLNVALRNRRELREVVIKHFLASLPVFIDDYKPLRFNAAAPSEQKLVEVLSQAV
ncbi:hypothetical protein B0H12DRAFT_1240511 [Mycena haematopus]|nr:hypothetical protein B0H12DRAFT_1240511 [Mycena haematopus]